MKIFAHRGNFESFPENSLAAFKSSIESGYDVEIDIRFAADKSIVLAHDLNLARLFDLDKNISDLNRDQISNLAFTSDQNHHLCLFEELAAEINNSNVRLAIHFKQDDQNKDNCTILAELFNKYQLYDSCFPFNLSLETCQILRELNQAIKLSVLVSDEKFEPFVYLLEEVEDQLDLFDILWAAEYKKLYSQQLIDKAHQLNKEIIAVSPELHKGLGHPKANQGYQDYWRKLSSWGVDGICTDYPHEFTESMQKVSHE